MYSCKHDFGCACGRAWMYMTARACVRSYVCMYVCKYVCMYVNIRVMWVYACVCEGVGVLVKVFKKQKQYVSEFQLKFKESGFCLLFGVGWGWRCPQKKKNKNNTNNAVVEWSERLAVVRRFESHSGQKTGKLSLSTQQRMGTWLISGTV